MPTDLYKDVLYTAGEGADVADLNNMRGYLGARMFDQVLRAATGNARGSSTQEPNQRTTLATAPFLYALSGGDGYLRPGAGALQTTVRGGTILQQVGSPSGDAASLLPYTMVDGEFTLTHATGDATNSRIDVIEAKLEYVDGNSESRIVQDPPPSTAQSVQTINKKRRVQATFQIKQGTPAATPAFPTLTSGFCGLGAVVVAPLMAGVFDSNLYFDLRIPIIVRSVDVYPRDFALAGSATLSTTAAQLSDYVAVAAAASGSMRIPCPLGATARIIGFGLLGRFAAGNDQDVVLQRHEFPGPTANVFPPTGSPATVADLGTAMGLGAPSNDWKWKVANMDAIEAAIAAQAGGFTRNAAGLGAGVWGNGRTFGPVREQMALGSSTEQLTKLSALVSFDVGAGADSAVQLARWFYAEGL